MVKEEGDKLADAVEFFIESLTNGDLVRDTTRDANADWTTRMVQFVSRLSQAQIALHAWRKL